MQMTGGKAQAEQQASDFNQLQREYRHMELNRRAYAEESQQLLRKQQMAIDKLRRDNEGLKTELAMEMRHHTKPVANTAPAETMGNLQDQGDQYTQSIEVERRNIRVMEEQIQLMREKILHQRKNMGGVNASKENQQMVQKQIRILENRLDKALVKFNEALAHNKELREQIDDLRRERVVFDTIYKKLEKELQEKKRQMANIIELSNLSYEQRDNYQMEIAAIEQANRKEHQDFEAKMMELGQQLEDGMQVGRRGPDGQISMGNMTIEEENRLKKKVNKGAWGIVKDKVEIQVSMERVQNFEEAFNKIKAATGISDIDELVRTFIKHEDQNFSLFNYVNEQTNEIEKLEEQIQQLKDEEAKYAQESGEDVHQHKQILKDLEARLQATNAAADKYNTRCEEAQQTLESLKRGIKSMFERVGAKNMTEIVSDNTITEANMMHYLGMIEQRTNEIMQIYAAAQLKQKERKLALMESGELAPEPDMITNKPSQAMVSVLGTGPKTQGGKDMFHVNPPKLEDYSSEEGSEDENEEARPLTREELKARTLNRIQRKNARDISKSGGKKIKHTN